MKQVFFTLSALPGRSPDMLGNSHGYGYGPGSYGSSGYSTGSSATWTNSSKSAVSGYVRPVQNVMKEGPLFVMLHYYILLHIH